MRKKISFILKILAIITSLGGVILSMIFAQQQGYSHWGRRLLYFTTQSNVWMGLTFLILVLLPIINKKNNEKVTKTMYLLKYLFTVSITITGLVFCGLLAPFAQDNYDPWTFSSLCTHVFTPILVIIDFFVDEYQFDFRKREIFCTAIPPFLYFVFTSILFLFNVDFGRGDTFPYFFLNLGSPAGIFGFSDIMPYKIGTFYWLLLILGLVLSIGWLYARLHHSTIKKKKQSKKTP